MIMDISIKVIDLHFLKYFFTEGVTDNIAIV